MSMNLISCYYCGSVVDTNRLERPEEDYDEEEGKLDQNYRYDSDSGEFCPTIKCGVCSHLIFFDTGEMA